MNGIDPRMLPSGKPHAKAWDIGHVEFGYPDLAKAEAFLKDFGLWVQEKRDGRLLMASDGGYGPCVIARHCAKPQFLGLALVVSDDDLDALSRLPEASPVEPAEGWPGGRQIRFKDPAGNTVRALAGPEREAPILRAPLEQNLNGQSPRLNGTQRPLLKPAQVRRLGHTVLGVVNFFACVQWYMEMFGLIPSDIQTLDDGDPVLVFMRCDRGDVPADHHTVVITQHAVDTFSHCAFECLDLDDIAMGQEFLKSRGWKHAWGIGRHLLGSQLFDYWRDPWGLKFEHFVDSDMFTADRPPDVSRLTLQGLYQWGPSLPSDFEKPKITPLLLWQAVTNIIGKSELNFRRLVKLLKISHASVH